MRPLIVMRCVTAVLLSAGAACAAAQDDVGMARLLTCLQPDSRDAARATAALHARAQDDGRGGLRVAGPVRAGGLCIENAQVMAAFGGLMIMGTLCDGAGPQALTDFVRGVQGGLAEKAAPARPGMLGVFEAQDYTLAVFRGEPGREPDPASKRIGYTCGYVGSGPQ
jgi:hypothetical protein